jgi:hypothetical protein
MEYFEPAAAATRLRYASSPEQAALILDRVGMAIAHLDAARLGARLYLLPHSPDAELKDLFYRLREDHFTLESAANNLVFRGVVTSLDLCAAAIWRVVGGPAKSNWEADMRSWQSAEGKALKSAADPRFASWIADVLGSHEWALVEAGRDSLSHRTVPRHVVAGAQPAKRGEPARPASTMIDLMDHKYDLLTLHPRLVDFGVQKWKRLCDLLQT